MRIPKIREIKEAIKAFFEEAYTTEFPLKPHIPPSTFRGKPEFQEEKCVGCGACVNVCPTGALSFKDVKKGGRYYRILKINWDICIECGQCQLYCLTGEGIKLTNEFDFSSVGERASLYQTIEKELVTCEICGTPFACKDHLKWTVEKLGRLYVSNTTLITFIQRLLKIAIFIPRKKKEGVFRWDRFRILCPRCRRKAVFTS